MTTRNIPKDSDLHKQLLARVESRITLARTQNDGKAEKWRKNEERMLAFLPETEENALRRNKREEGEPQFTTIQVPYSYAVTMALHTYLTTIFLSRSPVHQFAGRFGEAEQQTQAVEAIMSYQAELGGWMAPYYIWFQDACRYGLGVIGDYWTKQVIQSSSIVEQLDEAGKSQLLMTTQQTEGYQGNKLYNIAPYDFLPDPRVPVWKFQEGEFCAVYKMLPWHELRKRKYQGYYNENIQHLKSEAKRPAPGASVLERPMMANLADGVDQLGEKSTHPSVVGMYELFIELSPKEWGLGESEMTEKWVFSVDEGLSTIFGVEPYGALHGKFPFDVMEIEVEGYGFLSRGIPDIVESLQNSIDWLLNSHFYNVRAALNNQFIYDPTKIYTADVENGGPGFAFRLKPAAFGQKIDDFFRQIPVTDVTRSHVADLHELLGLGERMHGINDQILGVLNTGGRRTATEVRSSTGFGVNRQKTVAEYISAVAFGPHSVRMLQNTQQNYSMEMKLRLVGDLAQLAGPKFVMVDRQSIAGQYDFLHVDGTMPIDRLAQATLWKEIMVQIATVPQIAMQYDLGKIFAWVAQLAGLKNIGQFKVQVLPDQMMAMLAQAGNSVPIAGGGAPQPPVPGSAATTSPTTNAGLSAAGINPAAG